MEQDNGRVITGARRGHPWTSAIGRRDELERRKPMLLFVFTVSGPHLCQSKDLTPFLPQSIAHRSQSNEERFVTLQAAWAAFRLRRAAPAALRCTPLSPNKIK